jgi:uncharacterized repeat protein (TIGR01451 family)
MVAAEDDDSPDGPDAVFSTNGDFSAGGASGDDDDLFTCEDELDDCEDNPDFDVIFRGSRHGVRGVDIEAIELVPAVPVFPPPPQADLAITKVDTPDPLQFPGTITYTVTVTNNGPDTAFNSSVTDLLPAGVTPVSTSEPGCDITNPPAVVCVFGAIPSGEFVEWTITVDTDGHPGGDITNSAEAFLFFQVDPDSSNNTASTTTTVVPQP